MNNLLDSIEKHKFGLLAALAVYVGFFMYANFSSYTKYYPIEPFHDGAYIENAQDVIEIEKENIEIPSDYNPGDIKNTTQNMNDKRESSYENYGSAEDVTQSVQDLERQMYEEAGGAADREKILEQMKARQEAEKRDQQNNNTQQNATGTNAYAGATLVSYNIPGRTDKYLPTPGYLSDRGGVVVVLVKVNQYGVVTTATYDPSRSSNASQRMIDKSVEYAQKSRFNNDSNKIQSGWIKYTFVSK